MDIYCKIKVTISFYALDCSKMSYTRCCDCSKYLGKYSLASTDLCLYYMHPQQSAHSSALSLSHAYHTWLELWCQVIQ